MNETTGEAIYEPKQVIRLFGKHRLQVLENMVERLVS